MKKLIPVALFILSLSICFSACKKDDSTIPANTSIVGTWQLNDYKEVDVDSTTNPPTVHTKDTTFILILKFNRDSSAVSYTDTTLSFGNAGGYTLYGNDSIRYVFGPGPPSVKARYTIQDSTLTFFTAAHYLYDSFHYFTTTQTYKRLK